MVYKDYLQTADWKEKSKLKKSKRKRCAICADTSNLDVHHLNYRQLHDVKQFDLIVLCRRCHFLAHELHKKGEYKFKNDNAMSRYVILKTAVKKSLGILQKNMFYPKESKEI